MKLGKIFKFFKKGAKVAGGKKGKKGEKSSQWPSGTKIGIFGHANSGKTVYFTVLNEECKISKKLGISVTDNKTAGEFLSNFRSIWGLGTATDAGTVVDFQGEKKFPDPTSGEKIFKFNAIIDRSKKVSVVSYDYGGQAVAITGQNELADKVADFMTECDGILFFYDPKILKAELESQAHVASFVNILEQLAPLKSRLPIPVGLVITKSDILPGFKGEDQVMLIRPEDEYLASEDFESFLEAALADNRVSSDSNWAGSVRSVLVRMKEFLRVVLGRTLDFQVFFISSMGQTPEKIGTDIGRSIYSPPSTIRPIGVKEPFYWILNSIIRSKRISAIRTFAKYAATIGLIWCVLFSIPFIFHFNYLMPRAERIEESVVSAYDGNIYNASDKERRKIIQAYDKYERAWVVKLIFDRFQAPAQRIREGYLKFNQKEAVKLLNAQVARFASIVKDTTLWPKLNPSDQTLILNDDLNNLLAAFEGYHKGDEGSILYKRSGRALVYWDLFSKGVISPNDTAVWQIIQQQVQTDQGLYRSEQSKEELALASALSERKIKKTRRAVATQAAFELDDLIDKINGNESPSYRLDKAVAELRAIKGQLSNSRDVKKVNQYISRAKKWWQPRTFTFKAVSIPSDGHLHIEVTSKGKDPTWSEQTQILAGFDYKITWKIGDVIHIALDTLGAPELWGKDASDKVMLRKKYSIFDMDGEIGFDNIGKKVTISFNPGLMDQIPVLK
ncbi:MAG: GTPase domain-containing protein [candidate division Zixibacteria bacterium]|nr:GTPase domain-containing protein [candidate division Zixibacteria bacterium]